MGMLINGKWSDEDRVIEAGRFVRPASVYTSEVTPEIIQNISQYPGRFHLIGSNSCQWSHRAMILRQLKGLEDAVPQHIAFGDRVEGYAANGGALWTVPGTDEQIIHLHQLYSLSDPNYTGRVTVPILWDSIDRKIVCNESSQIMKALDRVENTNGTPDFYLFRELPAPEAERLVTEIYDGLNNGVYLAAFAESQQAYDEAVRAVFSTLDRLESRLSNQRYLLGAEISDADWRLFPTLFRFDSIFYVQHMCCLRRLIDYPNLWAYARDLYAWKGVSQAVKFDAMRKASYAAGSSDGAHNIVPIAPDADWCEPHAREALGPACAFLKNGEVAEVDPATLSIISGGPL